MLLVDFLIERLVNLGIKHVFGLPGEDILDLYKALSESKNIGVITCTDETNAAFAADAYARVKGAGCVLVPYKVGACKLVNTTQCAHAERSPVIVISGAPPVKEQRSADFVPQRTFFEKITCCSAVLDNPSTAGYDIDNAVVMLNHFKRPIYLEVPRDMLRKSLTYDVYKQGTPVSPESDPHILGELLQEASSWLQTSKRPVILAGVEVGRCGLGDGIVRFAEKTKIPIVVTPLSKSVVNENHPLFAGVYTRDSSPEDTKELVEKSDCLLMLGVMFDDTVPEKRDVIHAAIGQLKVRSHSYDNVNFLDFCQALFKTGAGAGSHIQIAPRKMREPFEATSANVTMARLFDRIDQMLTKNMVVVSDVGDALYGSMDLTVHDTYRFFSPAFYSSMGFAIPGAIAVQIAEPQLRPVVIVGDVAFQMSFSELSTAAIRKLSPIVFVLNNKGYSSHRQMVEGAFNNIRPWAYHNVPTILDYGHGYDVTTEEELEAAISAATASKAMVIINVHIALNDISARMQRVLGARK